MTNVWDLVPEPGENYYQWLKRIDPATASYILEHESTSEEELAGRTGSIAGRWALLFEVHDLIAPESTEVLCLMLATLARRRRPTPRQIVERLVQHANARRDTLRAADDAIRDAFDVDPGSARTAMQDGNEGPRPEPDLPPAA
jgi:hypothetical protein